MSMIKINAVKRGELLPHTNSAQLLEIDLGAIKGVTQDSRCVAQGFLFAALSGGSNHDGREYIQDAIDSGASVILTDESVTPDMVRGVQLVTSDNPRRYFSHIVAEYFAKQPKEIVAVTGTNGKSSVVHFTDQLWSALGESATYIGTLNNTLTTPDPVSLFGTLAQMADDGITHVALEASSHGLSQYRLDGADISVAAFTNFTQDHLDYHTDMEDYLSAKLRLFEELLPISGVAVLNADVPEFHDLAGICKIRGVRVLSYGRQGQDIILCECAVNGICQDVTLQVEGRTFDLSIPLVGEFQIMNLLCALGCVIAQSINDERRINKLIDAMVRISPVVGRLQHISNETDEYHGYVDYAHTPDALETVLKALRPHAKGRLICLFGCGGDRDKSKRPIMGEIAARLSDVIIITDDNPRGENPSKIRQEIVEGITCESKEIIVVDDRKKAILRGVQLMNKEDILLVAGKGHEQGQIIGGEVIPFDDAQELANAFLSISTSHSSCGG